MTDMRLLQAPVKRQRLVTTPGLLCPTPLLSVQALDLPDAAPPVKAAPEKDAAAAARPSSAGATEQQPADAVSSVCVCPVEVLRSSQIPESVRLESIRSWQEEQLQAAEIASAHPGFTKMAASSNGQVGWLSNMARLNPR